MTNNDNIISPLQLFPHLWEIDETAHRRVEQIMTELLEKNPAPDKSTQQLAWVQHMSSLKVQCNNTDNNYTDYSDTDLILSYPEWNRNDKM